MMAHELTISSEEVLWYRYSDNIKRAGMGELVLTHHEYRRLLEALPGHKANEVRDTQKFNGLRIEIEE